MAYIRRYSRPSERIIDVGAGASSLTSSLLDLGYVDIIALDVSVAGLEYAESRLGESARRVTWLVADITKDPEIPVVDLWHDRAVLHFLTDELDQAAYARLAAKTIGPGGHLIVATFAPDGPERCSGLVVHRHDGASLAKLFESSFDLLEVARDTHHTPSGSEQRFTWAVLRRHGGHHAD